MTHVDLFTGLGGFSLAARANGIRTIAMCECDRRCREFLAKAWPGIPIHPDVRTFPGEQYRGAFLLTAGVPCQPASRAGKQGGAGDDRWLWPAALAALESVRPDWCLFENPPGIEDVGLDGILAEVEGKGYEVGPVFDIPACAVDAPHRRQRFWIVAHMREAGQRLGLSDGRNSRKTSAGSRKTASCGAPAVGALPDAGEGDAGRRAQVPLGPAQERVDAGRAGVSVSDPESTPIQQAPTSRADEPGRIATAGASQGFWSDYLWASFPDGKVRRAPGNSVGLVDGLHRSVLGALGNSIVWQVAAEVIGAIKRAEAES